MPWRSVLRRIAAILHLPGVIECVPRDAAGRVALRPALFHRRRPFRRSLNGVQDGGAEFRDGTMVAPVRRSEPKAELSDVRPLGLAHGGRQLVAAAAAAARTPPTCGRRGGQTP